MVDGLGGRSARALAAPPHWIYAAGRVKSGKADAGNVRPQYSGDALADQTATPYLLTAAQNGCIIPLILFRFRLLWTR